MAICGPGNCDCAFNSQTLTITRDGNIITLEQAEFSDITELQEQVAEILAALTLLPATYVNQSGDAMTGALTITSGGQQLKLVRTDTAGPHIGFYAQDGTTRQGYIQHVAGGGFIINDQVDGLVRLFTDGTERMRATNTTILFFKTATNLATEGVEIAEGAQITSVRDSAGTNFYSNKTGSADVNGAAHMSIRSAGTQIGSITRATASTTAFNTGSDEDLKTNILPIDDELAEWVARVVEPYLFEFKKSPGEVHCGYIAQRVAAMWPQSIELGIVTPGHGNIEDRTFDEAGNETTPEDVWKQWEMDYSKLLPVIHAAWRSTANKLDALTARVEALETA